jgi:hypothetical protein
VEHGTATYHGDPRRVAAECGARKGPEKNTACSHFLHDTPARSFPDAVVCHAHRGNLRWSIGMTKTLLIMAAIAGVSVLPSVANAQERLGDGAMGALAGALVGGPVGRRGLVPGGEIERHKTLLPKLDLCIGPPDPSFYESRLEPGRMV